QKKWALHHQSKLLFRREAKPFSPLMRQSAYVHPKFFWAMVCRRIKQLLRKNLYEIEKKLGRFISKSPVLLLLLHMKSSLKVTQRAER
ncbi:hypothetical protein, partial [uncultured Duncaniella sp.]|uniref:hypothetical protein n=1 Tax=uncultured Duncaniella sp. TaxID=2768039 RepID=UPI0025AA00D3